MDWWPVNKCDYEGENGRTHAQACSWAVDGDDAPGSAGCSILNQDLSQPRLRAALTALGEAGGVTLRLGGSLADGIAYNFSGSGQSCTAAQVQPALDPTVRVGFRGGCLTPERWDELHGFAKDCGAEIVFGINALAGRSLPRCVGADGAPVQCHTVAEAHNKSNPAPSCCTNFSGAWDAQPTAALLRYTERAGHRLAGVEYGNELVGKGGARASVLASSHCHGAQPRCMSLQGSERTWTP